MKLSAKIIGVKYLNEFTNYWTNQDYIELLELFNFPDAKDVSPEELKEMLFMSISDFEPEEAAQIMLTYKLGKQLNEGQIESLSHEMLVDKVAEEYPEPELHYDLFNINQLLYKAYNGTFPNTTASVIEIELPVEKEAQIEMTEEIMTKLISESLNEKSLMRRLYADQIDGKVPFTDANKFIWLLNKTDKNKYELATSKYWIEKEDIIQSEYTGTIKFFEEH